MLVYSFNKKKYYSALKNIVFASICLSACTIPKNAQKNKPFIAKNKIEVKGINLTKTEKSDIADRLYTQLDDSSKVIIKDAVFFLHYIIKPIPYDTISSGLSAKNMKASMLHMGYYNAKVSYTADTLKKYKPNRVSVKFSVNVGKPTLIDTVTYKLRQPDLQLLTQENIKNTLLIKGKPVTRENVLGEINRLIEIYKNNGYYKITTEELKVRGDSTIEALTNISDDPFEQIRILSEAQQKRDKPTVKLAVVLNLPKGVDSNRIKKYTIGNVFILPDHAEGDSLNDKSLIERVTKKTNYIIKYHTKLFRTSFLARNMELKTGDVYNQQKYFNTITNFTKAGVWQSVNIKPIERKDSSDKIDLIVELSPTKKLSFEASVEASYSANSTSNSTTLNNVGSLLGVSGNVSLLNRNLNKEAIKMTHALRYGVELNLKADSNGRKNILNSREVAYTNSFVLPRLISPYTKWNRDKANINAETFISTNLSYIQRVGFFDLQSANFSFGYNWLRKPKKINRQNRSLVFKPLNIEFANLKNKSFKFDSILTANPFLKYSFRNALVLGISGSYSSTFINPKHNDRIFTDRKRTFRINAEESGLITGAVAGLFKEGLFKEVLQKFIKIDVEYTFTKVQPKSSIVYRLFSGVGFAVNKTDTTLPFFKQYFAGGSNSMRAWPIRGLGRGAQPLAPFGTSTFNDRTGDVQIEANMEYRFLISKLLGNSIVLKGSLFADAGNIWNIKNTKRDGSEDNAQFKFKNIYKQLGVSAGAGLRIDFNYLVVRFDMGLRFKRPDIKNNDGWQIPALSFNNVFRKGEMIPDPANPNILKNDDRYKKWRYENFNFSIGIGYPF
jgi:outer membrane protein insertion porin family